MSDHKQPASSSNPSTAHPGIPPALLGMVAFWLILLVFAAVLLLANPDRASREKSFAIPLTVTNPATASATPHSLRELETGTDVAVDLIDGAPQATRSDGTALMRTQTRTPVGIRSATPKPGTFGYRSPTTVRATAIPYRTPTPNYAWTQTASVITQTVAVTRTYQAGLTATLRAAQTQIAGTTTAMVATQTMLPTLQTALARTQTAIAIQLGVKLGYSANLINDSHLDVVLRNASGGPILKTLGTNGADNVFCDWSPDSSGFLFERRTGDSSKLIFSDLAGKETELTRDLPGGQYRSAAWSPAGNWILYQYRAASADPFKLYAMKLNTADPSNVSIERSLALTSGAGSDETPDWAPEGKTVVFSRDGALHTLDVSWLGQIPLPDPLPAPAPVNPVGPENGAWPHYWGTDLLFARQSAPGGQWDLFTALDGDWTQIVQLTDTADRSEVQPAWSGDGSLVIYVQVPGVPDPGLPIEAIANAGLYQVSAAGDEDPSNLNQSGVSEYAPRWVHSAGLP